MASWDEGRDQCLLVPEMWVLGGLELIWQAEGMAGVVGRPVTLSDLIMPVSKYTEDIASRVSHC